jgi:hypothetical protein
MSGFLRSCIEGFIGDDKYADEMIRRFEDANISNIEEVMEAPEDTIENLTFLSKGQIKQFKEAIAKAATERFFLICQDGVYLDYKERLNRTRTRIHDLETEKQEIEKELRECRKANDMMNNILTKMDVDVKKNGAIPEITWWMKFRHYYLGRYKWKIVMGVVGLLLLLVLLFLF